jgi:hypothetical protein
MPQPFALQTPIPGSPGYFAPGELSPEQLNAYLRRLYSGGGFGGEYKPAGGIGETGPEIPGPIGPGAYAATLALVKSPSRIRTADQAQMQDYGFSGVPQTPAQYEQLHPAAVNDLPSEIADRARFMAEFQGLQRAGIEEAKVNILDKQAEAAMKRADNDARLITLYEKNPGLASKTGQGAMAFNPFFARLAAGGDEGDVEGAGMPAPPAPDYSAPAPQPAPVSSRPFNLMPAHGTPAAAERVRISPDTWPVGQILRRREDGSYIKKVGPDEWRRI